MRNVHDIDHEPLPAPAHPFVRFLGGSPVWVAIRLVLVSILVGVLLAAFGLDPWEIVVSLKRMAGRLWEMGFEAVELVWRYFLLGAVLVVPIWLLSRILKASPTRNR